MDFQKVVSYAAAKYFPKMQIKYKDQSLFMKILGKILFFNKSFMTDYITTVGNNIYFPNKQYIDTRDISATVVLLHELVHMHDAIRINQLLFGFLYLFPISFLSIALLLFIFSWKIALILSILSLLPLPAYFRMVFERRAYMSSLYVLDKISIKLKFNPYINTQEDFFLTQFKTSAYYFMWIFNLKPQFDAAMVKILGDKHPFEDKIFDMLDDILSQI